MKNYKEFLKECTGASTNPLEFSYWIENCIKDLSSEDASGSTKGISEDSLTVTMAAIDKCLKHLKEKEEKVKYLSKESDFKKFKDNLEIISSELTELSKQTPKEEISTNTILESYSQKIDELKKELDDLDARLGNLTNNTDSKLFSTIINLIAILGIFVAISFAGFGSVSLVSKFQINMANDFLKSTFYIMIMALVIYNLVLLLIYFVLKIVNSNLFNIRYISSRTVFHRFRDYEVLNPTIIIIDVIMLVLTVALFVCSLLFK